MIKSLIKISGELLYRFPSLNNILLNVKSDTVRIVYYHMITDVNHKYYIKNKALPPNEFIEQIRFFKKFFEIISLSEAIELAKNKDALNKKLVITFDDGFRENYTVIAPILIEKRIPATFFLLSDCVDNMNLMWRNALLYLVNSFSQEDVYKLCLGLQKQYNFQPFNKNDTILSWATKSWDMSNLEKYINRLWMNSRLQSIDEILSTNQPYMTRNEISELISYGFDIGSHSVTHPFFDKLSYKEFEEEIIVSTQRLNQMFGLNIKYFAYPYGVRANPKFESRLIKKYPNGVNVFLGNKNSLTNSFNVRDWERDNIEFPMSEMMLRFSLLPILRNVFRGRI